MKLRKTATSPCPREGSTLVLLCSGSPRRPMWPRAAGSWSSLLSRSMTLRGECAPARATPARRRLSCQRVRSAPAYAQGGSECRGLLCAAAGLVFNECSICMESLDVGELLVCEQTLHRRKTLVEGEMADFFFKRKRKLMIQTVTSLFSRKQTCQTTVHAAHVPR